MFVVIVDKPFGRSSEEVDRVIQLAEKKSRLVTCFQNRRWVCRRHTVPKEIGANESLQDGGFQTLRQLIKNGALGEVKEAEIVYDFESAPWLSNMTEKKYTPGAGMAFGLGMFECSRRSGWPC